MGDGVGIPALGRLRDADDTLHVFAELAGLPHGFHNLSEQVFVGQILRIAVGETDSVIGFEFFDFSRGDLLEFVAQRFAECELLAVHENSI